MPPAHTPTLTIDTATRHDGDGDADGVTAADGDGLACTDGCGMLLGLGLGRSGLGELLV